MNYRRKEKIENIANQIVVKHKLNPGFDLAKFLLNPDSFEDGRAFQVATQIFDSDTTGILLVDDIDYIPHTSSHKLIAVNRLLQLEPDYRKRRRFIMAHEYGHYVLHKHDAVQYAHRDTSKKRSNMEQEADYFARCLLMPRSQINNLFQLNFVDEMSMNDKINIVSRIFNVTQKKSMQRLKDDLCLI